MKKAVCSLFLALAVLAPAPPAFSLEVGAPGRVAEKGKASLSGSFSFSSFEIDNHDFDSKSIFFKGAFGVVPDVTPYLKLGFSDLSTGGFEGNLGFAYGGGVLLRLMTPAEAAGLALDVDLQVVRSSSSSGGASRDLTHSQVSLVGSVRSGGTNTYGGLATSFLNTEGLSAKAKNHLFFGVDYFMDFNLYLNGEVHVFGEDSISLGVGYLF